ncbi:hypothetical protein GQ457_09G016630 [Hibiscus cannabinus]
MQWEAREGTISLFVENLPERLHWKGLWFAFARHGEVVNVYIARKKSRGGKRFGFVRMKNLEEADRVTQRLNGAIFYGSRLVVKIARDNRGQGWKRNTTGRSQSTEFKKTGITMDDEAVVQKVRIRVSTEEDIGKENFKRIIGHVENEDLWNLRRCLVGVMDMVCSVSSIHSRLLKWGLELSGKSLSDSDIKSRVSILVKEAKQVLNLGKKIGITIVGDENEAIKELVSLELDKGEYDDEEFASRTLVLAAMKAWGDLAALNFPLQYYGKDLEELKGSTSHEESILDCAMADWLAKDGQAGTKCSNPGGEVAEWLCFALSCGLVVSNFCNSS